MGISILVTEQKYYNEFKNDIGFVSNLADFTLNLAGSVMENIKVIRQIQIKWFFEANSSNTINSQSLGAGLWKFTALQSSTNFSNDGLAVGDLMVIQWTDNSGPGNSEDFRIQSMTNNVIIAQQTAGVLPTTGVNGFVGESVYFFGREPQTALIYKFGLLENTESFNAISKVSNNEQAFYGGNIGFDTGGGVRDTNWVTLQRLGQYQDWLTGTVRARFVSAPNFSTQIFEIEHEFTIVPYYIDGELTNLQNNVIPALLDGFNSLKYSYSPEFRTVLSNPNTAKRISLSNELGSVAWFNENFNGFNNNYQVNSVVYSEQPSGNSANGLLASAKTRVQMQVQKNNGNFVSGERVGVYVSYLPEQSEYENTVLTNQKENFLYDNAIGNAGLSGVNGQDFITNLTVFSPFGNIIVLQFDVEYSTAQKIRLANKKAQAPIYFLCGVELGDATLTSGNSDRLILLADVKEYDDSADIPDLMDLTKFDIYAHNESFGGGSFSTDMIGWNESGIKIDYTFEIDLNKQAFINTLEFKLVAFDPITQIYFELDSYSFNVANAIVSLGVQQLNENTTRNYILKAGDEFNEVTLNVGTNTAGIQEYTGHFAQKFKWQDWLQNLAVDTVFFDSLEPNNNLNFKSSNYSLLNGYEIRMAVFSNLDGVNTQNVSGNTDYLFLSPTLTVYDYTEDGTGSPVWSHVIETFDATGTTNLGGAILTGQDTLFRCTWTNSGGPIVSIANIFGINRIEETGQTGDSIEEMSSINLPPSNQLLKPSVGTLLDVTIVAGNVVFECFIDGSLVVPGTEYNLSSEIRDISVLLAGKQKSPSGDLKQKTDSTVKQKAP